MSDPLLEDVYNHIMVSAMFSLHKLQNCALRELHAEAEETVEHRAWWIENFGISPLKKIDFLRPNFSSYNISMMAYCKSVHKIQKTLIGCIKVPSVFMEENAPYVLRCAGVFYHLFFISTILTACSLSLSIYIY